MKFLLLFLGLCLLSSAATSKPEAPKNKENRALETFLQNKTFTWKGTNADRIDIHFDGTQFKFFADGKLIKKGEIEITSRRSFSIQWSQTDRHTYTLENDTEFVRFTQSTKHRGEGKIEVVR